MAEVTRMKLRAPPHPVLDAAAFPRVHAAQQPLGDRAAYAEYYPCGLPVTYKMIRGPDSHGAAQSYVEDNLPVGFYTNAPPNPKAIFSTKHGERPFRKMEHILPRRRLHLWSRNEIQSISNSLRKVFWRDMKQMQQPYCWDDLWTYFDAHDLYTLGSINLWNVINTMFDENKMLCMDFSRETAAHIGHWADEWLEQKDNQDKLTQWDGSRGPIFLILSDKDHESLGKIQDDVIPLIASALKGRRAWLLPDQDQRRPQAPSDLMSACRTNSVENWLAGQPVLAKNGLPPPPVCEPHQGSPMEMNAPLPYFVQNGHHYYVPQNLAPVPERLRVPSQAVQALQKSAAAATTKRQGEHPKHGFVIANGTKISSPPSVSGSDTKEKETKQSQPPSLLPNQPQNQPQKSSSEGMTPQQYIEEFGSNVTRLNVESIDGPVTMESSQSSASATLSGDNHTPPDNSSPRNGQVVERMLAQPMEQTAGQMQTGHDANPVNSISQNCLPNHPGLPPRPLPVIEQPA